MALLFCTFCFVKMSDSASEPSNIVCHPKGKSKVWKYFGFVVDAQGKVLNDKKVCCRLCKHKLGYSGNTTNLFYHLEKEHPDENTILRSVNPRVMFLPPKVNNQRWKQCLLTRLHIRKVAHDTNSYLLLQLILFAMAFMQ